MHKVKQNYLNQDKDLVKFWKYSGKITKEFDSGVKGFINVLHSGGLSKMQIPDSDKNSLGIVQSYIVFQVFVFSSKLFNIEVGFTDTSKTKRRLFFSNSSKEIVSNPFHCRVPLLNIPMASWVNISIDVLSFVSECFKASTFRSIDYISVTANCKLRRIFSMRNSLNETNKNLISDDLTLDFYELLPKNLSLPQNVNFTNFNFTYEKIRFELDEIKMQDINSGNSVNSTNNFNNVINSNFNNNNNKNTKDSNGNHNLNNHENNNNNKNNNELSSKRRKLNENGKQESNLKSYKSNLNKLKNFDINSAIGNYNTNNNSNNNNNNQNNNNKLNNNNNENANNQTNGISNFSNNNTNSNGLTSKNARAKSYSRINKFGKNLAANQTNISASNNENHNLNLNKSPAGEANLLKEKNDLKNHGSNNNNKNENLKKNLFEKNKNKIKYNIPTKINKFLNNKSNNNNASHNRNGINSKKTEASGSIGSSSAGGKTKADTNNHSEKNKSDNSNMNVKLNKQSNGLSKNNEYDYKSNSLLLNTLNYRNIDKWDNSKDNGGDSIEEIYEIEERNLNGKSMRKYSNSPENYNNNHNAGGVQMPSNKLNNSINNPDNNLDREENEELEDKFYYDIPIKDFKKKSQFKESGNFFTLNKNKDAEMTPQNQTQNNLNHFYQNNLNTVSNSNKSNYNTNNQFNFSKNTNMNLISNFQNNLNNPNNTNINSNNEGNKDKNKREIIEEILRDTSSGSFFARIDRERPFTPPFTKLVPMSSLEKINSSVIENKEFNNADSINNHNFINTNVNSSPLLNGDLVNSKLENLHNSQILITNNALNNSVQLNLNSHNVNANILNGSKIDDIQGLSNKMNPNPNESKMHDISYKIKDINYMDLIYDHVMGHYYDPKSNIYYELKNIGNANKIEIE